MSNVTIFRFDVYDTSLDGMVRSRRWATREAAEQIARGVVDEATAVEVPRAFLMSESLDLRPSVSTPRKSCTPI